MLSTKDKSFQGARVAISGSGNVAQFAAESLGSRGKPVTFSDSSGFIYDSEGIDRQKLAYVMDLKNNSEEGSRNMPKSTVASTETEPEPNLNAFGAWRST